MIRDEERETSVPLRMSELFIDVKVVGNVATTTMEMNFCNENDRILEGQLYFPLGEGQTVSRFAMEVDGKLREGVVVEKEKGRATFESTVRRKIDPGLLEWTKGNNFKARIYPITALGCKRIVIAYEQELISAKNGDVYSLPLSFKEKVDKFRINMEVVNQQIKPQLIQNQIENVEFEKWNESFVAKLERSNYLPNERLAFALPVRKDSPGIYIEKNGRNDLGDYFYVNIIPDKFTKEKSLPKKIGLLWDVSTSAAERDIAKELSVLGDYFKKIGAIEVQLVAFSNEIHLDKTFKVSDGNATDLFKEIRLMTYDGGTQLGCLDLSVYSCDEFILSTDGISNFGKAEIVTSGTPVIVLNSNKSADHSYLKYVVAISNGQYLNLLEMNNFEVAAALSGNTYKFISATYSSDEICETYPQLPSQFHNNFTLSGMLKVDKAELKLNFGFGNEIVYTITIILDKNTTHSNTGLIERIWAQKKLADLDIMFDKNMDKITALGKGYSIVTRNTSLIVLDRIEDYIEHEIVPPQEMQQEYFAALQSKQEQIEIRDKEHLDEIIDEFNNKYDWWSTEFKPGKEQTYNQDGNGNSMDSLIIVEDDVVLNSRMDSGESNDDEPIEPESSSNTEDSRRISEELRIGDPMGVADMVADDELGIFKTEEGGNSAEKGLESSITLNKWDPQAPYITRLKDTLKPQQYNLYLELRKDYARTPSFYLDVADFFIERGQKKVALRVLSNIAELELENPQLLRVLAHRLQQLGYLDLAIALFEEVAKLRAEEPQSFRDLGLAYAQNGQYQEAVDNLYKVVNTRWDGRFPGIEVIAACEMNAIISRCNKKPNLNGIEPALLKNMPVDVRIVINWDSDNCDMDLWVTDPRREKCMYNHNRTELGGYMSKDFTRGYGPEEFLLKKAIAGQYVVEVNYYGSTQQRIAGPTTIQAELYTNYGKPNQVVQEITLRLKSEKEVINLGTLMFKE